MASKTCRVCGRPSGIFPYCVDHKPARPRRPDPVALLADISSTDYQLIRSKSYVDYRSACWTWSGALDGDGAPILDDGRLVRTVLFGAGVVVDCASPDCLSPEHLSVE